MATNDVWSLDAYPPAEFSTWNGDPFSAFVSVAANVDPAHAAVISGASGAEPATSAERTVLKEIGLPVRNTGTYIGHGVEAQFLANLGIACAAIEHDKLFAPAGSGDFGASPSGLSQVVVTGVGNWRGEGLALIERVD